MFFVHTLNLQIILFASSTVLNIPSMQFYSWMVTCCESWEIKMRFFKKRSSTSENIWWSKVKIYPRLTDLDVQHGANFIWIPYNNFQICSHFRLHDDVGFGEWNNWQKRIFIVQAMHSGKELVYGRFLAVIKKVNSMIC